MFISQVPILIPLFIIGVAVFLAVVPIAMDPSPKYLIAVFFILTGVMVYIPFVYYKKQPKIIGRLILKTQLYGNKIPQTSLIAAQLTEWIQKLMEVVPVDSRSSVS
jgi:hypothetical protein